MSKFASGKYSYAISDRSGLRYKYTDMRREWNGLLVGKDEYESKHPQLGPFRSPVDAQALKDARPFNDSIPVNITFPTFNLTTVQRIPVPKLHALTGVLSTSGTVTVQPISVTPTGVSAQVSLGVPVIQGSVAVTLTGVAATAAVTAPTVSVGITTYTVTVASGTNSYGYGNKYYIAGLSGASPTLTLNEGSTYRFDQSDSSNSGHPFRFSTTANGTHAGGSEYTTGVTTNGVPGNAGAYTQITVAVGAPTLYYYCTQHSGMGGTANTP